MASSGTINTIILSNRDSTQSEYDISAKLENLNYSEAHDDVPAVKLKTVIDSKQPSTLDTPITIDGTEQTTVEGALGALNNKSVDIDDALSTTSENPVQNKIITNALNDMISTSQKGVANGVATLGSDGKIPSSQIPSTLTGSTIHKAEFNMNSYSSDENGIKAMILALGDFLGEIEYNFDPSTHKYLSKKAQIMHIELSDYMNNYNNHNNSNVYWYQPYNTSYIPYVREANYPLISGKYIYDVPTDNPFGSNYSTYTFTMPMENFSPNSYQFAYPLRVELSLPGIGVRQSSGAVYDTIINYIYNSVKFIRFKNYMCSNGNDYTNLTTGNYIEYKDFVSNLPWQTITVYYFDI